MQALINDLALEQQVTEPTHIKGNILDLVITSKFANNNVKITNDDYSTSDHYLVIADIASANVNHQPALWRDYHAIKAINRADFCCNLLNTTMFTNPSEDPECYAIQIKELLLAILGQYAPIKRSLHRPTPYPWQDDHIEKLKRLRHFSERQYKHSKQPSSKRIYKLSSRLINSAIVTKHKEFHADQIQPDTFGRISWKAVDCLLSHPAALTQSLFNNNVLSQKLQEFSIKKVVKISINSASLAKPLKNISSKTHSDFIT